MNERRVNVWIQQFKDRRMLMLQWYDPETGKRCSRSTGTTDRDKAEQARADKEYELNHGLHQHTSNMSWERFREVYEAEKLINTSKRSQAKAGYVFDSFESLTGVKRVNQINERTLSQYSAKLVAAKRKPETIKGHLAYLKAALRWAAKQRIIPVVPAFDMPKIAKGANKAKIRAAGRITGEEFERLLMKCPNDGWRLMLTFAWHCGMRRTEARNVRGQDIDLHEHQIAIPTNKAGDEAATVFITPDLDAILRRYWPDVNIPDGKVIPGDDVTANEHEVSKQFRRIARKATVRGSGRDGFCTLHDLRRNFGSRWAAKVPAQVLQRMMRHSTLDITKDYYADMEQAAVTALWGDRPNGNVTVDVTGGTCGQPRLKDQSTQPQGFASVSSFSER